MNALFGKRVLVVEDEYYIASDLERALSDAGAVPLGPVGDVADGLSILKDQVVEAAVLDINLSGLASYPIADLLKDRGVPYLLLTGYDAAALPARYREADYMAKPYDLEEVVERLKSLMHKGGAS